MMEVSTIGLRHALVRGAHTNGSGLTLDSYGGRNTQGDGGRRTRGDRATVMSIRELGEPAYDVNLDGLQVPDLGDGAYQVCEVAGGSFTQLSGGLRGR